MHAQLANSITSLLIIIEIKFIMHMQSIVHLTGTSGTTPANNI